MQLKWFIWKSLLFHALARALLFSAQLTHMCAEVNYSETLQKTGLELQLAPSSTLLSCTFFFLYFITAEGNNTDFARINIWFSLSASVA